MRPVALGLQQPQYGDVDAVLLAGGAHHGFGVLPPWQRDRHFRQGADHRAIGRHQHQPGNTLWLRRRLVDVTPLMSLDVSPQN